MTEEIKNQHKEHEHHGHTHEHNHEHPHEHSQEHSEHGNKHHEEKSMENKQAEQKKEPAKQIKEKKEEAIARGLNLHVSKKQCMAICRFIKNKNIDKAMSDLEQVAKLKRAIPFKGEIPHRKGKMMSGRYPVKASKLFINILKGLKGNASVNNLDFDKTRIYFASANWASRPQRREGRRAKRASVTLKAREVHGGNN